MVQEKPFLVEKTKGVKVMPSKQSGPKISVITASYNSMTGNYNIERAIRSVLSQNYQNIELIVIDGGSKDKTVDVIKKFASKGLNGRKISYWVSEKDNGVYDAMNKGFLKATGEVVAFLNSDDFYYSPNSLSVVAEEFEKDGGLGLVHGDILFALANAPHGKNNAYLVKSPDFSLDFMQKGAQVLHPAAFVKKKLMQKAGIFDLQYKSAADFDFFCRLEKMNIKSKHINEPISVFLEGGLSSNDKSHLEAIKIVEKHYGFLSAFPLYLNHYSAKAYRSALFIAGQKEKYFSNKLSKKLSACTHLVNL